jgi:CRISPR type III-A-associated RAMP protein Csm4
MTFDVVHLHFKQPLHLSRGKMNTYESSDGTLHSDTLQAALYVAALQLYGKEVAEDFRNQVRLSSAFPFESETGYWLPKPLAFVPEDDPDKRKDLKKIKYLRSAIFQEILQGKTPANDTLLETKQPEIWKNDTTQRVLIDRQTSRGVPFYLEKLYPVNRHEDRGLFVLVHIENGEFPQLESLFKLLADNGIGLQRGLGNGRFKFEYKKAGLSFQLPSNASSYVGLSLFRPEANEIEKIKLDHSRYQLVKRGGWISSPTNASHMSLRKKSVLMFAEGSVLAFGDVSSPSVLVRGKMDDLRPADWQGFSHEVWRDGRGIFLPMK